MRKRLINLRVRLEYKLADFWIGAYWDTTGSERHIWICLLPCFPIHIRWSRIPGDWVEPVTVLDAARRHVGSFQWSPSMPEYRTAHFERTLTLVSGETVGIARMARLDDPDEGPHWVIILDPAPVPAPIPLTPRQSFDGWDEVYQYFDGQIYEN